MLLDALPAQRHRVVAEMVLELGDETGLADTRITAEQHQHRTPTGCLAQCQLQLRELADPSDEVAAGEPSPHV